MPCTWIRQHRLVVSSCAVSGSVIAVDLVLFYVVDDGDGRTLKVTIASGGCSYS